MNVGKAVPWDDDLHKIQLSFGVTEFLVRHSLVTSHITSFTMGTSYFIPYLNPRFLDEQSTIIFPDQPGN